jgi:TP901-1 family phage major tail protein
MAKYCGKDFIVQRGNADGPPETFTTVAHMRSTSMSINNEMVDVTTKTDVPWRQILDGCGIQSMSISLSGIFSDDVSHDNVQADAMAAAIKNYKLVSGRGDEFLGPFKVTSFERTGEYNDSEQFSMTLESSDQIGYTPAP